MVLTLVKKLATYSAFILLMSAGASGSQDFGQFCRSVVQHPAEAFAQFYGRTEVGPFFVDPWNADHLRRIMYRVSHGDTFSKSMFSNRVGGISVQATLQHELFQVTVQASHRAIEDHAQLVFWDFIREGGLSSLPLNMKGVVFHTQTDDGVPTVYFFINQMRGDFSETVPAAYKNLITDYRSQVFATYQERLKLDENAVARLNQASIQVRDRTVMMIKTHQPLVRYSKLDPSFLFSLGPNPGAVANPQSAFYVPLPEHLEIESGVSLVYSMGPEQAYPFELISDIRVPRPSGGITAEPGRLIIKKKKVVEASVSDWAQIAAMFMGARPTTLHVQADGVHVRLFKSMGFQSTGVRGDYAGQSYEILSIPTQEFLRHHAMAIFESGAFDAPTAWMASAWNELQTLLPHFKVPSVMDRIRQIHLDLDRGSKSGI